MQQIAQHVHRLIREEADQQSHFIARIHLLNSGAAPVRGTEMDIQHKIQLAHVPLCLAPAPVQPQHPPRAVSQRTEIGHDVKVVQQQIVLTFLHHQHHSPRVGPALGLIGELMAPLAVLAGRTLQLRFSLAIQSRMGTQAPQALEPVVPLCRQRRVAGKARAKRTLTESLA